MLKYWAAEFIKGIEEKDWEMPALCYLAGIYKEKNYINAYRALRMLYEEYGVKSPILEYLFFINNITKLDYTLQDVIDLPSLLIE